MLQEIQFREGDDNFKRLYQGDGAVEFFADSLTNLDSTAVIPSEFQDGYTTTGLNNETNNVVSGYVCDSDSTNDAKYYARAFKAKPIEQPSSLFYVYFVISVKVYLVRKQQVQLQ